MEHSWQLLDEIAQGLSHTTIPAGFEYAIAARLDDALLAAKRAPLDALADQLGGLYNQLLQVAPAAAALAARTPDGESSENAAYTLGQIGFAQLVAAQAAERRVSDDFAQYLQDGRYKAYIQALTKQEYSNKELAEICGEAEETAARKLKLLRELGVTDFRREGTKNLNFLSLASQEILAELATSIPPASPSQQAPSVLNKLSQITNNMPKHLRHQPSISSITQKAA